MDWGYLHLVFNHFPIIGAIIATLLLISGMTLKNEGVKISGLGTIVFAALMAVITYLTGGPAEDAVVGLPGVVNSLISVHEDIATVSMYLLMPAGLLALITLYSTWKKEKSVSFLILITLVLSIVSSASMVYTGHTGGQIRHSEFRSKAVNKYINEHQNDKDEIEN